MCQHGSHGSWDFPLFIVFLIGLKLEYTYTNQLSHFRVDVEKLEKILERIKSAKALEMFLTVTTVIGSASLANQRKDWETMWSSFYQLVKKKKEKKKDKCKLEISNNNLTERAVSPWNKLPREVTDSSPLDPSWRAAFSQWTQYEDNGEIHQKIIWFLFPWNFMNVWWRKAESVSQRQAFPAKQVTPGHWHWNGGIISPAVFQREQTAEIISCCSIPSNDPLSPQPATRVPDADCCRKEYLCPAETALWG